MTGTVAGFRRVRALLRAEGFTVVERPGWSSRGHGSLVPMGAVNHHTASRHTATTRAVLRILDEGHSTLRGPLCNWSIDRDGTIYLHAAGYAHHAGAGGWEGLKGNWPVVGIEDHHDGRSPKPKAQLEASVALNRHLADVFGYSTRMICEHYEWAPRRKVDRFGVDGDKFRALVAGYEAHQAPPPPPRRYQVLTFVDFNDAADAHRAALVVIESGLGAVTSSVSETRTHAGAAGWGQVIAVGPRAVKRFPEAVAVAGKDRHDTEARLAKALRDVAAKV